MPLREQGVPGTSGARTLNSYYMVIQRLAIWILSWILLCLPSLLQLLPLVLQLCPTRKVLHLTWTHYFINEYNRCVHEAGKVLPPEWTMLVRTMFGDEAIQHGFLTDAYYDVLLCGTGDARSC